MKPMNELQKNFGFIKFLFIVTAMVYLMFIPSKEVYASELNITEAPAAQSETSNEQNSSTDINADGQTTLEDGYYIDENGDVYYDETKVVVEEPVIEDVVEEDEEVVEEVVEEPVKADKEETKKTKPTKKTTTENKQTKDTKEVETKKPTYSEADLRLLACLVYSEAGNQSYNGMLGVANVVLNRAKSDVYWHVNTIKEVIYDKKWSVQFAVTIKSSKTGLSTLDKALKIYDTGKYTGANKEAQKNAMNRAIKAAKDALEGKNNIGNFLCFQNKRSASSIKNKYSDYKIIGDHIFYRTK